MLYEHEGDNVLVEEYDRAVDKHEMVCLTRKPRERGG
jgi:hypothetical protein